MVLEKKKGEKGSSIETQIEKNTHLIRRQISTLIRRIIDKEIK